MNAQRFDLVTNSPTSDHIQQRDGRWVIVDMTGKGNRVRTVPIPSWVKLGIDEWATAANLSSGLVFQSVNKGGYIRRESMTAQAVRDIVNEYAEVIGLSELAAPDLR